MAQKKISCGDMPLVKIRAEKNLSIRGGNSTEILITIENLNDLLVVENENGATITCEEDCAVLVPAGAQVVVDGADGNVSAADLTGDLKITLVDGNLSLSRVGNVHCREIGGNCRVDSAGQVAIENLDGNLKGSELAGPLTAVNVDGNINIRNAGSVEKMDADGNINLDVLEIKSGMDIAADGNIQLTLPAKPGFILDAASGGQKIALRFGAESRNLSGAAHGVQIGKGGPRLKIAAGGFITITDPGIEQFNEAGDAFGAGIHSAIATELSQAGIDERIHKRIEERLRRAERRAEAVQRKAERRVMEAMRKVEGYDFSGVIDASLRNFGRRTGAAAPEGDLVEPVEEREEVTDAEKMLILNMLQEKKINAEEAERLLDALAGKFQ